MSNRKIHINEGQYRLLFERSGVSDEIVELSDRIKADALDLLNSRWYPTIGAWANRCVKLGINQMYPNGDVDYMPLSDIDIKQYCLPFAVPSADDIDFVSNITINAYGYNMSEISEFYAYMFFANCIQMMGRLISYYDPADKTILLSIPCGIDPKDGSIHVGDISLSAINHELKHAYQNFKRGGKRISDDIYDSSLSHKGDSETNILKSLGVSVADIRYTYYAFDLDEVDAHLQEIYIYVTRKQGSLMSSSAYRFITEAKKVYEKIYKYYTTSRYGYAIKGIFRMIYGSDVLDKYLAHCQKGIRRFDEHLRRIVGRIHDEYPDLKLFY